MAHDVQSPAGDLNEILKAINELARGLELRSHTLRRQSRSGNVKMALATVRIINRATGDLLAKHWRPD